MGEVVIQNPNALQPITMGPASQQKLPAPLPFPGTPRAQQQAAQTGQSMDIDAGKWKLQQRETNLRVEKLLQELEAKTKELEAYKTTGGVATKDAENTAAFLTTRVAASARALREIQEKYPDLTQPSLMEKIAELGGEDVKQFVLSTMGNDVLDARSIAANRYLDITDAALTLGTGAAYTETQRADYVKKLSPSLMDSPASLADKKRQLQELIITGRIKSGVASANVDAALKQIEELYGQTQLGSDEALKPSKGQNAVSPDVMERLAKIQPLYEGALRQIPRGQLTPEVYAQMIKQTYGEFDPGLSPDDPKIQNFVKAFNDPRRKVDLTIPAPNDLELTPMGGKVSGMLHSDLGAAAINAANAGGFGAVGALEPEKMELLRKEKPIPSLFGDIVGSIAPVIGAERVIAKGMQNSPTMAKMLGEYTVTDPNRVGLLADVAANAGYGGARGVVEDDGALSSASIGALASVGGRLGIRGAQGFMKQETADALEQLKRVDLTTAQRLGLGRVEEVVGDIPLVRGARETARDSYVKENTQRVLDEANKPLSEQAIAATKERGLPVPAFSGTIYDLPLGTKPGTQANDKVNEYLNEIMNYDLRPKMFGAGDTTFDNEASALYEAAQKNRLTKQLYKEYLKPFIEGKLFDQNGRFTGDSFKEVNDRLNVLSEKWNKTGNEQGLVDYNDMAEVAEGFLKSMEDMLARNNPAVGEAYKNWKYAWTHSKRTEDATLRAVSGTPGGASTPSQLMTSTRMLDPSIDKGRIARGTGFDQDFIEAGQRIMGTKGVPDNVSFWKMGAALGAPAAAGVIAGKAAIPVILASIAISGYTPGIKRITQALLTKRPSVPAEFLRENGLGPAQIKAIQSLEIPARQALAQALRNKMEGN